MPSPKKLLLKAFVEQEADNTDRPLITHGESGWSVAGTDCVLMRPDGRTSFDTPQQAFRVLAGVGIRSAIIEWDGLDAITE
ncbi:hypothetical protein [Comamonas testosteroni]|jgi:hypothetical protein|uniref:hypothetical protein n=1 Tax=Comamonas testosteroni TaxID=285 RepID=UPI0026F01F42|nr:hypothetical protein [Comamonas testosteroni]